jgi:transcription initiation factor TFIIIB Brf1 subunit/transcription initiation factor TFIIB
MVSVKHCRQLHRLEKERKKNNNKKKKTENIKSIFGRLNKITDKLS